MSIAQYHGKVYRSLVNGALYTKTPNGNVLYKHPVRGVYRWRVSRYTIEHLDIDFKAGHFEVVDNV